MKPSADEVYKNIRTAFYEYLIMLLRQKDSSPEMAASISKLLTQFKDF